MELNKEDERWMREALKEAKRAFEKDEVPIGAIIVCDGIAIARAYNYTEHLNDVTAHAEMQAITSAANNLGGKYLQECTLYVTIEPCVMCAGALFWAQIGRIVYGANDPKRGFSVIGPQLLHPSTKISKGVLEEESSQLMKTFFEGKRKEGY
ncbi:MAG TPA: nucleoside deaminase [Bacteroidia bacterium]|nr:nucleoside deaminase [Bacteroidia bacterium]